MNVISWVSDMPPKGDAALISLRWRGVMLAVFLPLPAGERHTRRRQDEGTLVSWLASATSLQLSVVGKPHYGIYS